MGMDFRAADIRAGVDQPLHVGSRCTAQIEAKGLRKEEVRAIAALLIPALDSSADGAGYYCQVKSAVHSLLVIYLGTKRITLFLGELMVSGNILVVLRVLGDQRPLLQQVSVLGKALPISEIPHLRHQLMLRRAGKEVPDLGIDVVRQVCTVNCRGMVAAFLCMVGCFVLRSGVLLADPLPVQKRGKW